MVTEIPQCIQCIHYFISHDPDKPYGCRAMAFKCRINPARLVYQSSGIACQLYTQKKRGKSESEKKKVA